MSNVLGTIQVWLQANTANFTEPLTKAAYVAQVSARKISREFESLQKVASQTFGAFGAANPIISQLTFALSSAGKAASTMMKEFGSLKTATGAIASLGAGAAVGLVAVSAAAIKVDAEVLKMAVAQTASAAKSYEQAQAAGVTTQAFTELSFAAKQNGVEQELLTKGLGFLNKEIYAAANGNPVAAKAFKDLGINVMDANHQVRDAGSVFPELMKKFDGMANTGQQAVQKVALMRQMMGRGGDELLTMARGLEANVAAAHKFGVVITDETGAAAHEFEQTIGSLNSRMEGLHNRLMTDMLPAMQRFADKLAAGSDGSRTAATSFVDQMGAMSSGTLDFLDGPGARMLKWLTDYASGVAHDIVHPFNLDPFGLYDKDGPNKPASPKVPAFAAAGYPSRMTAPFDNGEAAKLAAAAAKKLAEEITKLNEKLQLQIATFGMTANAAKIYELAHRGASAAVVEHTRALMQHLGILEAGAKMYAAIAKGQKDLDALDKQDVRAQGIASIAAQIDAVIAATNTLAAIPMPAILGPGMSLQSDLAARAKAMADELKGSIADFGKSDIQIKIESLGAGATEDQIAELRKLDQQMKILQAGGYLQWQKQVSDENQKMVHGWDEAALAGGTFGERMRAMFNELVISAESLSQKITRTFTHAFDQLTGELAKAIVTGRANTRQILQGIEEEIVKATLQAAISGFVRKLLIPSIPGQQQGAPAGANGATPPFLGGASGGGGIRGAIGGIFGKVAGSKPDGSQGNPFYVVMKGGSGSTASGKGVPGISGGEDGGDSDDGSSTSGGSSGGGIFSVLQSFMGKTGGVISSIFKGIGSIFKVFTGFLGFGGGGSPPVGRASIVGEEGPELFVPDRPGTIIPNGRMAAAFRGLKDRASNISALSASRFAGGAQLAGAAAGGGHTVHVGGVHLHLPNVGDADGFRRSKNQIHADIGAVVRRAVSRKS